jgi:hypothetical protein
MAFRDEDPAQFRVLTEVVLRACHECEKYCAEFPNGVDPAEQWRREQNAGKKNIGAQIKAARILANYAREHPLQVGFSLAAAGFKGRVEDRRYPIHLADSFSDLLSEYERHLLDIKWMPFSFLNSTKYFNLVFPEVKKRRPPILRVSTGLMLRLIMVFRKFTAREVDFRSYQIGETIPTKGESHYDIAAEFAQAATGQRIDGPEKAITKLLKAYPRVGIGGWRTLSPELVKRN